MARFRSGNLVLTSTQTIIQGNYTVLDATRKGSFNALNLDSTGVVITEFSTDTTLAGNSDTSLPTEKAVKSYVDAGISGISQNKISQLNSKVEVIDTGTGYVDIIVESKQAAKFYALSTKLYYNGTKKFETTSNGSQVDGDLFVTGNLTIDGTSFVANTVTVLIEDNLLVINKNEIGAGVTVGVAGIEVERGSVTNYQFLFDETQDNFRIGMTGSLQAVATREDTPVSGGVATWNNTAKRFDTTAVGTAFNKNFGSASGDVCQGNDSRLSDARTPVTHAVNASTYGYGDITNAGHLRVGTGLGITTGTISVSYGTSSITACVGNDSRLSDARTPVTHNNTYHSATYIAAADVNYTNLNNNGSVGTGSSQVAQGNHAHGYITNTGYIGTTATLPLITTTGGLVTVGSFSTGAGTFCQGNDSRLSDARTPVTHNNTYHSVTYIVAADVNYTNMNASSSVGTGASQVAKGNHVHGNITNTGYIGTIATLPLITTIGGIITVGSFSSGAGTFCQGNDSRLSDARTPVSHNNTYHSATYIVAADVTYTNLNNNSSVGTGATQVAQGNHTHSYLPLSGGQLTGILSLTGTTKTDGYLYAGTSDPTNSTRLNYDGYFYATRVYNAVWNDIADYQKIIENKIPGKCYYGTLSGAKICSSRCQKAVIGILSDTYGIAAGYQLDDSYGPIAIAGWVLAYIDDECEPGDVLTNGSNGNLVKMTREEKLEYPEKIVAIYGRPEPSIVWGTDSIKVQVDGRHWVQVK